MPEDGSRSRRGARPARERAPAAGPTDGADGSAAYPGAVNRLMESLARLPGVGRRSAERMAFHLLRAPDAEAAALARAVEDVKRTVRHCEVCWNLADAAKTPPDAGRRGSRCAICEDPRRDRGVVLVVEQPRDLIAVEQAGHYRGIYHVLLGRISPLEGVDASAITLSGLTARVRDPQKNPGGTRIREVILGLNPTVEGDGTALYAARELKGLGVKVSRLARGLPTGTSLEFANTAVLADAIDERRTME